LSEATRIVPFDWEKLYGYQPHFFETFVEVKRFQGAVNKPANWISLVEPKVKDNLNSTIFYRNRIKEVFHSSFEKGTIIMIFGKTKLLHLLKS